MKQVSYLLVFMLMLVIVGCSPVDETVKLMVGDGQEETSNVEDPIVLESKDDLSQNVESAQEQPKENLTVSLYFADPTGQYLVEETRGIDKVVGIARATVEELINGPTPESGLTNTIPIGTQLLDINVKENGLCIVSFSGDLSTKHWGGSAGESLTVYSIVNTLTQFPTITEVQILVDDQIKETLAGHLDISQPLGCEVSVIKNDNN